jgi:hypothetical protein
LRNGNLAELLALAGPPRVIGEEAVREDVFSGYWSRKETDGMDRPDPAQVMPGLAAGGLWTGQRARELARVIGRLTVEWLF